ncbi:MAG: PAS domain-containing sensor histidine kinase [Chloroflexi bacterium]|nr:PAS domain-containing sensor histidine kinase [Chloroflexota bacterium]
MSRPDVGTTQTSPVRLAPGILAWFERARRLLYPYRPQFMDRRFWAVQALVLIVGIVHFAVESLDLLQSVPGHFHSLTFIPVSMFFIPVVYAALNFGFTGSVATAAWCTLLVIPNVVVFHPGLEGVAEVVQIGIVDALAVFVGQRVEREKSAHRRAELAAVALRSSEMKYRGLFESSPVPVIVLDHGGLVLDSNPAAGAIFGSTPEDLRGRAVAELVGASGAEKLLSPSQGNREKEVYFVLRPGGNSDLYLEPTVTTIGDGGGRPFIQVLLRDVTLERQRQVGLRAYAAHVLRAQEEERKRIAQELHDDTVQALVLLCRRLDTAEGASESVPRPVLEGLRGARKSAEEVVQRLRDFARVLRPPTLEDLGLTTSIRRLLTDLGERANVESQLKIVGRERRLSPDTELGVFRIAQEALRNVERHARATQLAATITFAKHRVSLDILDNGVGFVLPSGPGDFAAGGQLGLLGMRERAESLGGQLEIQSTPGRGTRVTLSVQVQEDTL